MINQEEIHNQCLSKNPKERIEALHKLRDSFSSLPDKQQAWNDLYNLARDDSNQRYVRRDAIFAISSVFSEMSNKERAWNDLIELANDGDNYVRYYAASALGSSLPNVSNKEQSWNDLIGLTNDVDGHVRRALVSTLRLSFSYVSNKEKAWNDLVELTNDIDEHVRKAGASALSFSFSHVPDKEKAWNDLIGLTNNEDWRVRQTGASTLGFVGSYAPHKEEIWNNLIELTSDKDSDVRRAATYVLGYAFPYVSDKQKVWNDLHKLTKNQDSGVRRGIVDVLGSIFFHIPDKDQVWNDLHKLTTDENSNIRASAASSLGSAFAYIPNKEQASNDLHRLTNDEECKVRRNVAYSLGFVFSHMPNKQEAWNDLIILSKDSDKITRESANYSLGKVSIFKASQAEEDDYRRELKTAIKFFEKAEPAYGLYRPSHFCLPFYRSFYSIVFGKHESRGEIDWYVDRDLEDAKNTIKGSKSKKLLLEAVENLANALKEVQNLKNLDLGATKGELNFYRKYCDRAAELMRDTEETAPFATIAVRKGLPILDRNLKELLEEIQKKAKIACKEAKGTDTEEIACAISKEVQKWEIGSQEEMTQNIESLIETFRMRMPHLPGYEHIFEEIEGIRNVNDLTKQYKMISRLVGLIPIFGSMPDHVVQDIKEIKEKTTSTSSEVKYLQILVDRLIESVSELQNQQEYLDIIQRNLEKIKNDIPEMKGMIDEVLYELYSPLSTDQKLKIAIPIIPALVSYEIETNVPNLVADKIDELKNLVLHFKKDK